MTSDIFRMDYKFKKLPKKTLKKVKFKEVSIPKMPYTMRMGRVTNMANNKIAMPVNKRSTSKILRMTANKNNGLFNVIKKTKTIGMNRIKQQKGLSPFGDFDKDGLINMLDCNPINFFEQGPSHTVETKLNDGMYIPEDDDDTEYREPAKSVRLTDAEILQARRDKEAVLRAKAYAKAQKLKESQYVRDQVALQRANEGSRLTKREKALRSVDTYVSAPGVGISKFSKAVTGGVTGVGGFGINKSKLATVNQGMSKSNKLLVFMGKEPIPEQNAVVQPQQVTQSAPSQGGVESLYSKRRVSYVRGPYKK